MVKKYTVLLTCENCGCEKVVDIATTAEMMSEDGYDGGHQCDKCDWWTPVDAMPGVMGTLDAIDQDSMEAAR